MRLASLPAFVFMVVVPIAAAADPLSDGQAAWAKVHDYTTTIITHETSGTATQDRTYTYAFEKPTFAKIDIIAGPGKGGGSVWRGGDSVKGHQGGLFSGIHLTVDRHDSRAVSLRGDTIDSASFDELFTALNPANGSLTQAPGPTINGAPTDAVLLRLNAPDATGVTRIVVDLSRTTHLPVRREKYVGDTLVKFENFTDTKIDPPLPDSTFAF